MANTSKMDNVIVNGIEYAFSKVKKDYTDYYFNVYVNGVKDESMTYYTDSKDDAENTREYEINRLQLKEEPKQEQEKIEETAEDKITLTEKEKMVLTAIINKSNFNFDNLDITKEWKEQSLEEPDTFYAFPDTKDYGCGLGAQATRGIFGSLQKKGLIMILDDRDVNWLTIGEEEFNRIKKALR